MIFGFIDKHVRDCTCSYCCGSTKLHYGLNIPANWRDWNAWWVIKFWPRRYLRWINEFLK